MLYTCTKTYGHEQGLSCVFRQWRATSHCAKLHGYALSFSFEFGCKRLDENGWVVDFGSLKPLKEWLQSAFDHQTLVANDDPQLKLYADLHNNGIAKVHVVEATGCEAFARLAALRAQDLVQRDTQDRAFVISCTVAEHGGNSATYHALSDRINDAMRSGALFKPRSLPR